MTARACGKCGEPIADERVVAVGDGDWHERCALGHLIENMAQLTTPAPRLLNAEQVGEQIGTSASTVHRLAREGALGYIRMSRPGADDESSARRFRQAHVDEFLAAREQLADEEAVVEALTPRRRRAKPLTDRQQAHRSLVPRSQRDRQTGQR